MDTEQNLTDRRLQTPDLMQFFGYKSRTTLVEKERAGVIPKRKMFPDGRLGIMLSEVKAWAAQAVEAD